MLRTCSEPDLTTIVDEVAVDKPSDQLVDTTNLRGEPGGTKRFIRSLDNLLTIADEVEDVIEVIFY